MAIQLSDNLKINVGAPIDSKYLNAFNAPYADVLEVNTTIPIAQRYVGLTVNISNVEYWYETGVADVDLVMKGSGGSGSGERIEKTVTQTTHGFSIGEVVTYSGGSYIKAIADGTQGGEVIGFVSQVNTVDEFVVVYAGNVEGASISGLGLSASTTYYLSTSVAGGLQSTKPTIFGHISKPILVTFDTSSALIYQYRGFVISSGSTGGGGTSGITQIENIGVGEGIFSGTTFGLSGETAQLKSIIGSGNTTVIDSGDTLVILSSGATGIYSSASPSNIEVGGVSIGTTLTGRTLENIIEEILVTTFFPTLVNPNNTFSDDAANIQEVGVTVATINFNAVFDRGLITPAYGTSGFRSGLPNAYNYTGTGLPATTATTSLTDVQQITNYVILAGTQSWTNTVSYDAGEQPKDSDGNNFNSPLPSGTTGSKSLSITGIYPWFYGTVASGGAVAGANRPLPDQALINSGTKVVAGSDGTIVVNNFSATGDDYVWFAIPSASVSKTIWYASALSNGTIGVNLTDLFPSPVLDGAANISINSPSGYWSGINYDIYIASKQQAATYMEFRNS